MTKTALYGHFSEVYVREGQILKKGDKIGRMGDTGVSYGAHLHLCVASSAQTDRWYLSESAAVYADKAATDAFLAASPIFLASTGKRYSGSKTTDWLGYENHVAYDLISGAGEWPMIIWNQSCAGRVVQVVDDGDNRYGKCVLVQFPAASSSSQNAPKKTISELAAEVWAGKWGNGDDRRKRLTQAGYSYADVQAEVNKGRPAAKAPEAPKHEEYITTEYIVERGDTLSDIGARLDIDWRKIAADNGISSPYTIYPGQRLQIGGRVYTVQPGDTLSGIADRYDTSWQHLADINQLDNPSLIHPGDKIVID